VIWSAIGGSAAFLLGVHADVALPIAGIALAIFSVRGTTPEQQPAGRVFKGNQGGAPRASRTSHGR
jgi:hypothetical protein